MNHEYKEYMFGGVIISAAIILHIIFTNRSISMSRALYTLTGNEMNQSVSRYPLLLGLFCTASYLSLSKSSIYEGGSDSSELSIFGLIISGLLLGIGTAYATFGIESAVYNHLPSFSRMSIVQVLLMIGSGMVAAILKRSNPNILNWFFSGSNDIGININQDEGAKFICIASGALFIMFVLYHKIQQNASNDSILRMIISFFCGGLYAIGTIYAGLTNRSDVYSFLNLQNGWQAGVGIALLTVLIVNIVGFYFLNQNMKPEWDAFPKETDRSYLGSILFGLGWGFCGLAIGPVLISAATCNPQTLVVLLPSLLVGYQSEYIIGKVRSS